ncbi:hypothetical protein ABWK57_13870 [Streptomyces sp. NPDC094045]|uniref:hypothetical protein n=1 Tax=unclassified Streptomyces TaxID=2593676 RepID=UPI003399AA38
MSAEQRPAPIGFQKSLESPASLRIGDLILWDGVYFRISDMAAARGGSGKILRFDDREPMLAEGTITVYRPTEHGANAVAGGIVYSRR